MITAAILTAMANDIAGITVDANAFWEELPLMKDGKPAQGIWIVTRGGFSTNAKALNNQTIADIYVAFNDKTKTEAMHAQISAWIRNHLAICELSGTIGDSRYDFTNIRIRPATTPSEFGITTNGNIVKLASAQIYYDIN